LRESFLKSSNPSLGNLCLILCPLRATDPSQGYLTPNPL